MNNPERNKLTTTNLAEVSYLLGENHSLTDARLIMGHLGAEEMLFTLEGKDIMISRRLFMGSTRVDEAMIPSALEEIRRLLWKKEEAAL